MGRFPTRFLCQIRGADFQGEARPGPGDQRWRVAGHARAVIGVYAGIDTRWNLSLFFFHSKGAAVRREEAQPHDAVVADAPLVLPVRVRTYPLAWRPIIPSNFGGLNADPFPSVTSWSLFQV